GWCFAGHCHTDKGNLYHLFSCHVLCRIASCNNLPAQVCYDGLYLYCACPDFSIRSFCYPERRILAWEPSEFVGGNCQSCTNRSQREQLFWYLEDLDAERDAPVYRQRCGCGREYAWWST